MNWGNKKEEREDFIGIELEQVIQQTVEPASTLLESALENGKNAVKLGAAYSAGGERKYLTITIEASTEEDMEQGKQDERNSLK